MKIQDQLKIVKLQDNYNKYIPLLKTFSCKRLKSIECIIRDFSVKQELKSKSIFYLIIDKRDDSLFGVFAISAHSFVINSYQDDILLQEHAPAILIDNYALNDNRINYDIDEYENLTQAIFYTFILDIVKKTKKDVGVEYISLFAADVTETTIVEEMKLVNLYKTIGFKLPEKYTVDYITPYYDKGCLFMIRKI